MVEPQRERERGAEDRDEGWQAKPLAAADRVRPVAKGCRTVRGTVTFERIEGGAFLRMH